MTTIVIKEYNDERFDEENSTPELYANRVFEDVVSFQIGHQMLQMVFPDGTQKIVTGFLEIDVSPSEEERGENLKRYNEMLEEEAKIKDERKAEEKKPKLQTVK